MHLPQHPDDTPLDPSHLALACVDDAHNIGCLVRVFGEAISRRAQYSAAIQTGGVVVRTCHLVVVDRGRDPLEVVWRIGTRGIVEQLDGDQVTLNLGYRRLSILLRDERPAEERSTPLAVGESVLLHGSPLEAARVMDVFVSDALAHPERLQAQLTRVIARHPQQ